METLVEHILVQRRATASEPKCEYGMRTLATDLLRLNKWRMSKSGEVVLPLTPCSLIQTLL